MRKWAWLGQWLAMLACSSGIGVELAMGADIGYVVITASAVIFAMFTKLRRLP